MSRQSFTNNNHAAQIHASKGHQHAADRWVDPDWGKAPKGRGEGGIWLFVVFIILCGVLASLAWLFINGVFQ